MRTVPMTLPLLALVAMTRGMGGAGLALLNADRLTREQRRAVGWTLFFVGAVTTLPLAVEIFGRIGKHDVGLVK